MNQSLKTLANLTEFLYAELKRIADDPSISEKAYPIIKAAAIDAINLKRKIQDARDWNRTLPHTNPPGATNEMPRM